MLPSTPAFSATLAQAWATFIEGQSIIVRDSAGVTLASVVIPAATVVGEEGSVTPPVVAAVAAGVPATVEITNYIGPGVPLGALPTSLAVGDPVNFGTLTYSPLTGSVPGQVKVSGTARARNAALASSIAMGTAAFAVRRDGAPTPHQIALITGARGTTRYRPLGSREWVKGTALSHQRCPRRRPRR